MDKTRAGGVPLAPGGVPVAGHLVPTPERRKFLASAAALRRLAESAVRQARSSPESHGVLALMLAHEGGTTVYDRYSRVSHSYARLVDRYIERRHMTRLPVNNTLSIVVDDVLTGR